MIGLTRRMAGLIEKAESVAKDHVEKAAAAMETEKEIPPAILDQLWENGFLTLLVPKDYDGQGVGLYETARVIEGLSRAGAAAGLVVLLQQLALMPILQYAEPAQKEEWLKKIVHERRLLALAVSEPEPVDGEDYRETHAAVGEEIYTLNGRKVFVSRGRESDLFVVFAVTDPDAGLEKGLSGFLVEKGTQGFFIGETSRRPGIAAVPWSECRFEECPVKQEQRIGAEGQGYTMTARALLQAGPLLAAAAAGLMQRSLDVSLGMIKSRGQAWTALNEFQPVEILLADMSIGLEAARALAYRAAQAFDENAASHFGLSRHAKTFATHTAVSVAEKAVEIFGNYGVLADCPLRGILDDALVLKGMLGANPLQRTAIVRDLIRE